MKIQFNKFLEKCKQHMPEILMISGTVGIVGGVGLAVHETTKLNNVLEKVEDKPVVSKVWEVSKLYAPSAVTLTLSILAMWKAKGIVDGRNEALTASLAAVTTQYCKYRQRVVERYGEEVDYELANGIEIDKDGHLVRNSEYQGDRDFSEFDRLFDDLNINYQDEPGDNLSWLKLMQAYFNDKLAAQGYLFLNDVYESLGFPTTKAGQVAGWVRDEKNGPNDFVDLGILYFNENPLYNQCKIDFLNGYEKCVSLHFNCRPTILEYFK